MKLTLFFLAAIVTLLLSCSSNCDRLIAAFTSETGISPSARSFGNNKTSYTWTSVSLVKRDVLKNLADKELKMAPTQTQDVGPALDENGNPLMGKIQQSWIYDTPGNKTELIYQLSGSTIDVILTITQK